MQKYNLYLELEGLHELVQIDSRAIELFQNLLSYILQNAISPEVVMMTVESHELLSGICKIIALVSHDHRLLGRQENYDNCIYSKHSDSRNRIVAIESANKRPGYLSLDRRVKSEIFVECVYTESINLILNAEFSTANISDKMKKWFDRMCGIVLKDRNDTNILHSDNPKKEP